MKWNFEQSTDLSLASIKRKQTAGKVCSSSNAVGYQRETGGHQVTRNSKLPKWLRFQFVTIDKHSEQGERLWMMARCNGVCATQVLVARHQCQSTPLGALKNA